MSRLIIWICAVIASILILAMQSASAQDVIWGCLGKSGNVRIVGGSGECKSSETEIWWNQQGPEGPPGEQGPQEARVEGPEGPQGPAGEGCVKVYSAIGEELGILVDPMTFYIQSLGMFAKVDLSTGENVYHFNNVIYEFAGCNGEAFTRDSLEPEHQYRLLSSPSNLSTFL